MAKFNYYWDPVVEGKVAVARADMHDYMTGRGYRPMTSEEYSKWKEAQIEAFRASNSGNRLKPEANS